MQQNLSLNLPAIPMVYLLQLMVNRIHKVIQKIIQGKRVALLN